MWLFSYPGYNIHPVYIFWPGKEYKICIKCHYFYVSVINILASEAANLKIIAIHRTVYFLNSKMGFMSTHKASEFIVMSSLTGWITWLMTLKCHYIYICQGLTVYSVPIWRELIFLRLTIMWSLNRMLQTDAYKSFFFSSRTKIRIYYLMLRDTETLWNHTLF